MKLDTDTILVIVSVLVIVTGSGLLMYAGRNNLLIYETANWGSLLILVVAGILTWAAMVWVKNNNDGKDFAPNSNQYVSLGFSVFISILWLARYVYTITNPAE